MRFKIMLCVLFFCLLSANAIAGPINYTMQYVPQQSVSSGSTTMISDSFIAGETSTWLMMASGVMNMSDTTNSCLFELDDNTSASVEISGAEMVTNTTRDKSAVFAPWMRQYTEGQSAKIDIKLGSPLAPCTAEGVRYVRIRIDDLNNTHFNYTYNFTERANLDATFGNASNDEINLTFTPLTEGEYLILAFSGLESDSTTVSVRWRLVIDEGIEYLPSTPYVNLEDPSTSIRKAASLIAVRNFNTSTHTMELQAISETGALADWDRTFLGIVRLEDVFVYYDNSSVAEKSSAATATSAVSLNVSTASLAEYVVLGHLSSRPNSITNTNNMTLYDGAAGTIDVPMLAKDDTDVEPMTFLYNFTGDGATRKIDLQFINAATGYAKNAEMLIIDLSQVATVTSSPCDCPSSGADWYIGGCTITTSCTMPGGNAYNIYMNGSTTVNNGVTIRGYKSIITSTVGGIMISRMMGVMIP